LVYRVRGGRVLGDNFNLERPVTKLEGFSLPLETFLMNLYDQEFCSKRRELAGLFLEPQPHVATFMRVYSTDVVLLPPSHPLLLLNYGMIYEAIATNEKNPSDKNSSLDMCIVSVFWGILKRRFGAFLYQQEKISIETTIGELMVP